MKKAVMIGLVILLCIIGIVIFVVMNNKRVTNSSYVETPIKNLEVNYDNISIKMDVLENWNYETNVDKDENQKFIIKIYPNKDDKERYVIINKDSSFGVCGTGLETKKIELNNGGFASAGYYWDIDNGWQFITFSECESMYAWNKNLSKEEADKALEMIKTIQFN